MVLSGIQSFFSRNAGTFGVLVVVFVGYLIAAKVGQYLFYLSQSPPAFLWPPVGIALAAVLLYGYRVWPAIALAAFVSVYWNQFNPTTAPFIIALGSAVGNTLQPLAGVYILRRVDFDLKLARLRDMFALIFVAGFITTIAPAIGALAQWWAGELPQNLGNFLSTWWESEVLSVLILTPLIISWFSQPYRINLRGFIEILFPYAFLGGVSYLLFWTPYTQIGNVSLVYLLLIPLFWISLRFGPRDLTFGLFFTTVIAVGGIFFGSQATTDSAMIGQRVFLIEIFMEVISIMFLILSSAMTERRQAIAALREHVDRLEDALEKISSEDQAKNEFLAILAHELRNPLAPVVSSLEILEIEGEGKTSLPMVRTMHSHIRTMVRLLDDLLDVSRISRKKMRLQAEVVALHTLINRSVQMVETQIKERNHHLTVSVPEKPLWIHADPVRIEQVIANLLSNSAKYTEPGGQISLTAKGDGGVVTLTIKDNGIGIAPRMLKRIFDPFQQVENMRRQNTGLGIGLSLAKNLVEMHGGTIEAKSEGLGKGSEFIVELPLAPQPSPRESPASETDATNPTGLSVLVVDDNEAAAKGLEKLLGLRGNSVRLAHSGSNALTLIQEFEPDVVLLDIGLPDIDGLEVARTIRNKLKSSVKIVALTGYGQEEDRRRASEAGFDYYLTKPVSLSDIEKVFRDIAESR
jgi:signal transduction histidine kinase/ActR/RegA family two-component response regulator